MFRNISMRVSVALALWLGGFLLNAGFARAQPPGPERVDQAQERQINSLQTQVRALEEKVRRLGDNSAENAAGGLVVLLFAAFCALWAQNTNRSAILWFLLGAFCNVIAVIVLLFKNENDRERARRKRVYERRVEDR